MEGKKVKNLILFLGGGASQVEMIEAFKSENNIVCVVDRNPDCPGSVCGDYFINQSTWSADEIAPEVYSLCSQVEPSDILIVSNSGGIVTLCAQKLSELLGVGFVNSEGANAACSKSQFKQSYNRICNTNYPYYLITKSSFDWQDIVKNISGDLFIKPDINIIGKSACSIVLNPDPSSPPDLDFSTSSNGKLLIESYYPEGRDLIVLALVRNRQVISQSLVEEINIHDRGIINIGFCTIPFVSNKLKNQLIQITEKFIKEFEVVNAPVSISLRVKGESIYPVELHLDFGGENIFLLAEGVNGDLKTMLCHWLIPSRNVRMNELHVDSNKLSHWALYEHAFSEWSLTGDLDLINRRKIIASTGRTQYMFSLTQPESEKLLSRFGIND